MNKYRELRSRYDLLNMYLQHSSSSHHISLKYSMDSHQKLIPWGDAPLILAAVLQQRTEWQAEVDAIARKLQAIEELLSED